MKTFAILLVCAAVMDCIDCHAERANNIVDDSALNAKAAKDFGWHAAHLVEPGVKAPEKPVAQFEIKNLEELRTIFPELFKSP